MVDVYTQCKISSIQDCLRQTRQVNYHRQTEQGPRAWLLLLCSKNVFWKLSSMNLGVLESSSLSRLSRLGIAKEQVHTEVQLALQTRRPFHRKTKPEWISESYVGCCHLLCRTHYAMPIEAKIRECLLLWGAALREARAVLQHAPPAVFVISDLVLRGVKCAAMAARAEHNNRQELT